MDAVADGRKIERGERIKEASGESTEAAVTESHVIFLVAQDFGIETHFPERVLHLIEDSGAIEAVREQATHEEFEREVANALGVDLMVLRLRGNHSLDND